MRIKICQNGARLMPAVFLGFTGLFLMMLLACKHSSSPSPLTGTVTISGTAQVGYALTANTQDLQGGGAIGYQWKRGVTAAAEGTDISGATSASYTLVQADEDKYIKLTVSRSDRSGTLTSESVGPVTAAGTVSGVKVTPENPTVFRGRTQQFSADVTGTNNPPQTVIWEVSGNSNAGTQITNTGLLTVAANEAADSLTVTATSTLDTAKSGATTVTVIDEPDPLLQGTVTITGLAQVGKSLTANTGNLGGEGAITYQWLRCDTSGDDGAAISPATTATYTAAAADEGKYLKVRVSRSGYGGSVTSLASEKVLGAGVTAPTVSGVTIYPSTNVSVMKGNNRQFTAGVEGANNPPQTVTWSVSGGGTGTQISGSGLLTVALDETAETLIVTATSTIDTTKSGAVTVTIEDLPALSGAVIINGAAQAGLSLTANTSNLHGNGTISYQWKKGSSASAAGTDISGATSASYTVVTADVGAYISVTVSRSDRKGTLTSESVGPVASAPAQTSTLQGTITVSDGITTQTVSFTNTGALIVPANGSLTVTVGGSYQAYRWFVDGVEIPGEGGGSLVLSGSDYSVGQHRILVIVYRDNIPYSQDITFTVGN